MSRTSSFQGSFISDFRSDGMVHVSIIRSPIASGSLRSLRLPDLPRDYVLIRAQDIPGSPVFRLLDSSLPLLASTRISYPGEPLALLVGPDPEVCDRLRSSAEIECDEEWPLFSFESFSSDQILCKRSLELPPRAEGEEDPLSALSDPSFRHYERSYRTGSQDHWYSEPQGAFVSFEYDKLVVRTGTQWPFHVRDQVASALGKSADDIVVIPVGGSAHLDGKLWYPSLLASYAALAAQATGRNARILLSRHEDFQYSPKRSRSVVNLRAALSEDGALSALDCQIILDSGAHGLLAKEMLERMCASVAGAYAVPALRVEAYAVSSNSLPLGPCSGLGMSQTFFAIESFVSDIIQDLEADPLEWRKANLLKKGSGLPTGERLKEPPPFATLSDAVCRSSDFRRKHASFELLRKRGLDRSDGPVRGIGFSFAFQADGFLTPAERGEKYSVGAVMEKDLGLSILTGAVPANQGIAEIWRREAASILSMDPGQVTVKSCTTEGVPNSGPSTLSRNVSIITGLVRACAQAINSKRFRDPLPIRAVKTYRTPSKAKSTSSPVLSLSWAACVVELELDGATFEPKVSGIWLAIDAGRILSPDRAISSLEASSTTALSWASKEKLELVDGRVAEHVFMRYSIPRTDEIPPIHVSFVDAEEGELPRGMGELPGHVIPAAYARALAQAIGNPVESLPADAARSILEASKR